MPDTGFRVPGPSELQVGTNIVDAPLDSPGPRLLRNGVEQWILRHYRFIIRVSLLAFLAGLALSTRVGFTYDLLSLQAQDLESVQTEKAMLSEYDTTVLSGAVLVSGEEEARRVASRLRSLPTVQQVSTVSDLLPPASPRKVKLVEQLVKVAGGLYVPRPVALDRASDLTNLQVRVREIEEKTADVPRDPSVTAAVEEVKRVVLDLHPGPLQDGLLSFQRSILEDFTKVLGELKAQQAQPLTLDELPPELLVRYVSPSGVFLLNVQPSVDIWDRDNLRRFLAEVEGTGVTLVGHPVVQAHILESFDQAFQSTPFYTLLGVFLVMLLYLRRPGLVFLSSLPTAMGVVLIFGVMGASGMDFNVVNFVGLPISVGVGAVYGVHALHRLRESNGQALFSTSTGQAILLSGLTTIAGFASLMTARHGGLSSLGFVISIGVTANLLVSLVVLPAVWKGYQNLRSAEEKTASPAQS